MAPDSRLLLHPETAAVMDWDKLRVFHAAADAGSFTHAGNMLNMSQSALSRQVSALEQDLGVPLFHRHARGLILTEQGELLYRTAHDVLMKLEAVRTQLTESHEKPSGALRITATMGLGSIWLTGRIKEFLDLYPGIQVDFLLDDADLDLAMREADIAIRLHQPTQPDLIQRKLFEVHFHIYASPEYIKRFGQPHTFADLDNHKIMSFGHSVPSYLQAVNFLETAGRQENDPRKTVLRVNSVNALRRAALNGIGLAMLPDYLIEKDTGLVAIDVEGELPTLQSYFVYPEELRNSKRVSVFRDFLLSKARHWSF
jgi:DNA-binding transcriptional LysR family regulator